MAAQASIRDSGYWNSPHSWTPIHESPNSIIGRVNYQIARQNYPEVVVSKSIAPAVDGNRSEIHAHLVLSNGHPNIIKYYHSFSTQTKSVIYMEYADWGNAESLIKSLKESNGCKQTQLIDIMWQLVEAVGAMHGDGWAHRDIKPSNVLVFLDGRIKLGDFGTAKRILLTDEDNTVVGSPAYMSPNLEAGMNQSATHVSTNPFKDDIYSLGSTFFSLSALSNLSEFGAQPDEHSVELYEGFIRASMSRYSEELQELVIRMVSLREEDRPTIGEVKTTLGQFRVPIPQSAPADSNLVPCPNCRGTKPMDRFITLNCDHRFCDSCFNKLVGSQCGRIPDIHSFQCASCPAKIDSFLLTNRRDLLGKTVAMQFRVLSYLSFPIECPGCRKNYPMFCRGKRKKKIKTYQVSCSECQCKFCSFCGRKGRHTALLFFPKAHCPFFQKADYIEAFR